MTIAPEQQSSFSLVVDERPDRVVVLPLGDLDISAAARFRSAFGELTAAGHTDIELDLSGLRFMDSTGLNALVRIQLDMTGTLTLVDPPAMVRRMLDVCQLTDRFTLR